MSNYKYHILICGGTGCHASESAKIKANFENILAGAYTKYVVGKQ